MRRTSPRIPIVIGLLVSIAAGMLVSNTRLSAEPVEALPARVFTCSRGGYTGEFHVAFSASDDDLVDGEVRDEVAHVEFVIHPRPGAKPRDDAMVNFEDDAARPLGLMMRVGDVPQDGERHSLLSRPYERVRGGGPFTFTFRFGIDPDQQFPEPLRRRLNLPPLECTVRLSNLHPDRRAANRDVSAYSGEQSLTCASAAGMGRIDLRYAPDADAYVVTRIDATLRMKREGKVPGTRGAFVRVDDALETLPVLEQEFEKNETIALYESSAGYRRDRSDGVKISIGFNGTNKWYGDAGWVSPGCVFTVPDFI